MIDLNNIKVFLCSVLLMTVFLLPAQVGDNPFDIPSRKAEDSLHSTPVPEAVPEVTTEPEEDTSTPPADQADSVVQSGNPFNIERPKPGQIIKKKKKKDKASTAPIPQKHSEVEISKNFLFTLSTILIILLTLAVALYGSYISKVYRAFLNENFLKMIHRDHGTVVAIPYLILYGFFFVSAGAFVFLVFNHFKLNLFSADANGLVRYIAAVAGVFMLKHLLLKIIAFVFPISKVVNQYSFTIIIFCIVLGLILIPANILIAHAPASWTSPLIYGTFVVIILLYLFRILRSLLIAIRVITLHKFHFFMYLCTLEIAPLVILIKMVLSNTTEF